MKKLIALFVILLLLSTGCTSQTNTESNNENNNETNTDVEAEPTFSFDLKDTELLKNFILEKYPDSKDDPLDKLIYKYNDFNKDGIEDVVCYFDLTYTLDKPVFISQKYGKLYEIENNMEWFKYTQEIEFDDDFIFRITTSGGTGISQKIKNIYVYDGEKIVFTDGTIILEGYESGPNYNSEYTGNVIFEEDGDYKNFINEVIHTGDNTSIEKYKYTYNPNVFKFEFEDITKEKSSGDAVTVSLDEFENETLYSRGEPLEIDYSKYSTIIIPMQDTINKDKLTTRNVDVTTTGNEAKLKFTVLGKLFKVNLEYKENGLSDPDNIKEFYISDEIENEIVIINAALPNDFSTISISGSYKYKSELKDFSFSMNDMAEPEELQLITIDSYDSIE